MITVGKTGKAKYWGNYTVTNVVQLQRPVKCFSHEVGEAEFEPVLVRLKWDTPPSDDTNEFWFPYWISINGKHKYGQFAPMMGEGALLELLSGAIQQGYFSPEFLKGLNEAIARNVPRNGKAQT